MRVRHPAGPPRVHARSGPGGGAGLREHTDEVLREAGFGTDEIEHCAPTGGLSLRGSSALGTEQTIIMPYAKSGGIRLYYEEAGTGVPVIFAHEYANELRGWETQLRYLSRYYRCIAYNARGFPPSDIPEADEMYGQQQAPGHQRRTRSPEARGGFCRRAQHGRGSRSALHPEPPGPGRISFAATCLSTRRSVPPSQCATTRRVDLLCSISRWS
jgi:hypothetical protein